MQTVSALRTLSRHRVWVAVGAVIAVLIAAMVGYRLPSLESRSFNIGVATGEILVDTPTSQVVAVSPDGVGSVSGAANLLATIMTQGDVKAIIAKRAGLAPQNLFATSTSGVGAQAPVSTSSLRTRGTALLTTENLDDASGNPLPLIWFKVQASDTATAERVASAAVTGLLQYLNSTAASERIPDRQRFKVKSLGPPESHVQSSGPGTTIVLGVAIAVFAIICSLILFFSALTRDWRRASAAGDDDPEMRFDRTPRYESDEPGNVEAEPEYVADSEEMDLDALAHSFIAGHGYGVDHAVAAITPSSRSGSESGVAVTTEDHDTNHANHSGPGASLHEPSTGASDAATSVPKPATQRPTRRRRFRQGTL